MVEVGGSLNYKVFWIIECKFGFIKRKGESLIKLEEKESNYICFLLKEK